MRSSDVYINDIATAVPEYEGHAKAVEFVIEHLARDSEKSRLRRISDNLGIHRRYTVLEHFFSDDKLDSKAFYRKGQFPGTAERMRKYREEAPKLTLHTIQSQLTKRDLASVSHLIVTSCTGFYAPGLDIDIVKGLGLSAKVERTLVGYMGCYGAIAGLRLAYHMIRSQPEAVVLMVNLELCSLHWKNKELSMDQLISFMMFGDGCAASLMSSRKKGLQIKELSSHIIPDTYEMMGWTIGDDGFYMNLDARIPSAISDSARRYKENVLDPLSRSIQYWAIHPGGRAILDSIQESFELTSEQMSASQEILRNYGNMSSPTVMFILKKIMLEASDPGLGCALAFGPGLTLESCIFQK